VLVHIFGNFLKLSTAISKLLSTIQVIM